MVILQSTNKNSSQIQPSSPSSLRPCQSQCGFPDGDFREEVERSVTRGIVALLAFHLTFVVLIASS